MTGVFNHTYTYTNTPISESHFHVLCEAIQFATPVRTTSRAFTFVNLLVLTIIWFLDTLTLDLSLIIKNNNLVQ